MRLLAIDFGTSNTVAALAVDGQAPRTVTFDASPLLPSAVFLAADGAMSTGREAQRQARLDPSRFEPNPKRRIDDGEILLGDRVVPVVDVIAAVLRTVAAEVRRQLGGALPDEVRLTHPAQWGASRQNTLVSAARTAGLGANLVLLPEPVAAAAQFTRLPGRALPPGGSVAVYDLGGGTFDIAVVGRTAPTSPSGAADAGGSEFHVLAEAGLGDLGGLDFDQAVLDHIGRSASAQDPARWQAILRPADASGRRAARALAEDVRAAKETLSRYPQTEVALPDPFTDAHLTRSEFQGLIRPNLVRSIEVLSDTLRQAGVEPARLTGIFLVGGSSRIPLVASLIQERLQVIPVALDQPETAVALGALLVPVRRQGNRTVAMADDPGDRPVGVVGPPAVGRVPPTAAAPRPGPLVGSSPVGPGLRGHVAGSSETGAGQGVRTARGLRRRRGPLIGGAVGALLVVVALVLILVRPFSGTPSAGSAGTPTASAGPTSGASGASSPAQSSAPATTGLGPGRAFTLSEMTFLGGSVNNLTNCGDVTAAFDPAVPADFRVARAVRCDVPDATKSPVSARTLLYVLSAPANDWNRYLGLVVGNRRVSADDLKTDNTDDTFKGQHGTGRVVTAAQLPALGNQQFNSAKGVPVLAWGQPGFGYVGVLVALSYASDADLTTFWETQYKPR